MARPLSAGLGSAPAPIRNQHCSYGREFTFNVGRFTDSRKVVQHTDRDGDSVSGVCLVIRKISIHGGIKAGSAHDFDRHPASLCDSIPGRTRAFEHWGGHVPNSTLFVLFASDRIKLIGLRPTGECDENHAV